MRRLAAVLAAVLLWAAASAPPAAAAAQPLGTADGWFEGAGAAWDCNLDVNHAACNRHWPGSGGVQSWGAFDGWLPAECMGMWFRPGSVTDERPAELWLFNPNPSGPGCAPGIANGTAGLGWCAYRQPDPWQPGWCDGHSGQASLDNRWASWQRVWLGGSRYGTVIRLY